MAYSLTCAISRKSKEPKGDAGGDVYQAIASTDALDRDRDVMLAEGCVIEDFMKNPVMLYIHNYRQVPVAKVLKIDVNPGEVAFDFTFAETDIAKEMRYMYDNGFMNAFSVGFYPKTRLPVEDDTPDKFDVDANGSQVTVDLTKYSERPRQIICTWELLEISPVPVPANPEALLLRAKDEMVRKYAGSVEQKGMVSSLLDEQLVDVKTIMAGFMTSLDAFKLRGAVPGHTTPVDMDTSWDGAKARAALAKWASSDGSGDKDKMNWAKFSKGFAWFDSDKLENFTAYKLGHHIPKGDGLVAIWRGMTAAMSVVLEARGGVDVGEDKQKVYNHLAKHYKDANKPVPELGRTYDEAELKAIEDGTWEPTEASQGGNAPEATGADAVLTQVTTLAQRFAELEDTISIRMSIFEELLKEAGVNTEPGQSQSQSASEQDPEHLAATIADMNIVLAGVFATDD
jgi:phage head maturation protease